MPYGFADDTTIVGCPHTLASIMDDSEPALANLTGLRLNRAKVKTLPPVWAPATTAVQRTAVAALTPMSNPAIKVLGVPVGDPASSEVHNTLVLRMAGAGWPHAATRLLQIVGVRRYAHFLRG